VFGIRFITFNTSLKYILRVYVLFDWGEFINNQILILRNIKLEIGNSVYVFIPNQMVNDLGFLRRIFYKYNHYTFADELPKPFNSREYSVN
jgi:hypothetical protein